MPSYRFDVAPDIAEIPRLNDWIETCCGESGVVGDVVFKLTLALEEAVTNVIQHAFTGRPPPHRCLVISIGGIKSSPPDAFCVSALLRT